VHTGGARDPGLVEDAPGARRFTSRSPRPVPPGSGVQQSDLLAIGGAQVAGASGGIRFDAADGAGNRMVFFAESLGTFATGYLLPAIDED
jgi:hypothetical protein